MCSNKLPHVEEVLLRTAPGVWSNKLPHVEVGVEVLLRPTLLYYYTYQKPKEGIEVHVYIFD